jgi:hypothetical protein
MEVADMVYELWDSSSGNAIAGFPTEAEALGVVRAEIEAAGFDAVSAWFLRRVDARGRSKVLADGAALVERAVADVGASRAFA